MPHQNFILLLRHCVRSTKTKVKICNGENSDEGRSVDISDYTASPFPNWNTPENWCTELGMDLIKDVGKHILNEEILGSTMRGMKNVHVNLISDTSHRDVDTALAFSEGMKEAAASVSTTMKDSAGVEVTGLDDLTLTYDIFHPEGDAKQTSPPICPATEYTDDELAAQISVMRKFLPQPEIGGMSLHDMAQWMDEKGGVGSVGSLSSLDDTYGKCAPDLGLRMQLLKQFAEMAFYSRASGIDPPFLPNATVEDVYLLLGWADYERNVARFDNIRYAKSGVVLARSLLDALQSKGNETSKAGKDQASLTVYFAHDGNIDSIANTLGLKWKLEPPYRSGLISSPPGSGMMFVRDGDSKSVSLSYLYPVLMNENDNAEPKGNGTKPALRSTPMVLTAHVTGGKGVHGDKGVAGLTTIDALEGRLVDTLEQYPSLLDCYAKFPNIYGKSVPIKSTHDDFPTGALFLLVIVLGSLYTFYKRRTFPNQSFREYNEIPAGLRSNDFELQ